MSRFSYPLVFVVMTISAPATVQAQEEDGGMLANFLQDTLSGDNRNIEVKGLQGALSSKATIEELTVADDDGIWLTIKNAELDWNRLALIRGQFSVNALTAQKIDIARTPGTTTTEAPAPTAETQPFQLPELPVAIEIGEIRVNNLSLGEPVIGVPAELEVTGRVSLANGALDANLGVTRLDRPGDSVNLTAQFENETSQITLDLDVAEASGGLISTALKIPDSPPIGLTAKGSGPVTDFTADISLSSDNVQRVAGQVRLREVPAAEDASQNGIAFAAELSGDLTPFLAQDLDPFFGNDTRLALDGQADPDGSVDITDLDITSQALKLEGELDLAAGGSLRKAALQARITPPDGDKVVLPIANGDTSIGAAQLSALFDQNNGNFWDLSLTADKIASPQIELDSAHLTGQGTLEQGEKLNVNGDVQAALDGLNMSDPALTTALGNRITLDGIFDYGSDQTLELSGFELVGADYTLGADALVSGLTSGLRVDGSVSLNATDLSRFSDLAKMELGGSVAAQVQGNGSPLEGSFDGKLSLSATNLSAGRDDIDPLISGNTTIALDAKRGADGVTIRDFTINGDALEAQANAVITTPQGNVNIDGQATVNAPDMAVFSGLAKRELGGSLQGKIDGSGSVKSLEFDARTEVLGQNIKTGMPDIDPLLAGRVSINLDASRTGEQIVIRSATVNGKALSADVAATINDPTGNFTVEGEANVDAPDLSLFSGLAGVDLTGTVQASAKGSAAKESKYFDVQANVTANQISTGIEAVDKLIQGRTTLDVNAANDAEGLDIQTFRLQGTALSARAAGKLDPGAGGLNFTAALDDLARVSSTVSGPLKLDGNIAPTGSGLEGNVRLSGPDSSFADLIGTVNSDGSADLDFDAELNRLERFAPEFPGSISAIGSATRDNGIWTIDAKAEGPAQVNAVVAGTFEETSGNADLTAKGGVNIGIANRFISPNKIDGQAQFDVVLKGHPGLDAVSGTITTSGTNMAIPSIGQTITGIGGSVELAQSQATISLQGGLRAGGNFTVSGPVGLKPPFNAQITTALNNLVLTDKLLYETTLNGQIVMAGALVGNSSIAGQINFGETNINLAAASGAVGAAPIPPIQHIGESPAEFQTRERADLVEKEGKAQNQSRIALDVSFLAPKAVFVRGRGVNAELGGSIRIAGTTTSVVPSGQIELIRGNLDILGRRLALTKGLVTLQGDLTPYIEFASSASTSDGTASIEISGPLDSPKVEVTSDPERPAEEALAMLLFGNRFSQISPFVIAQMAASLAQLSGAGGDATKGVRDATGVDTVDVGASEGGAGRLGAGAYLSDNLYTDFTVNTEGDTEVNLNLDVSDNFTVRGSVDGRGETGIGVFFESDY